MTKIRLLAAVIGFGVAPLAVAACSSDADEPAPTPSQQVQHGDENTPSPPQSHRGAPPGPPEAQNGHWDGDGNPVNGGPIGADGSTGNDLTQKYCAQNEDPGCPIGSYVAPEAMPNLNGDNNYVPCEGTICTNPNHGAGDDPDENGQNDQEPSGGN